jgi:hypothetical protein
MQNQFSGCELKVEFIARARFSPRNKSARAIKCAAGRTSSSKGNNDLRNKPSRSPHGVPKQLVITCC